VRKYLASISKIDCQAEVKADEWRGWGWSGRDGCMLTSGSSSRHKSKSAAM